MRKERLPDFSIDFELTCGFPDMVFASLVICRAATVIGLFIQKAYLNSGELSNALPF